MTAAFIVEGQMEQRIVGKLCPGVPVLRIGANGRNVRPAVIAKFVRAQTMTLGNRHFPIIVVFDREGRKESCATIANAVLAELEALGLGADQVRVIVADRATENWFLPFLNDDGSISPENVIRDKVEGAPGKSRVKEIFKRVKKPYVETTSGVELFCSINPRLAAAVSASFSRLVECLEEQNCRWVMR